MLVKYFWLIAAILFAPYAAAQVSKAPVLICTPISQVAVSESGETVVGAVVANLLANPDVAINLESVLRRVMSLDWQTQGAVFAGAVVSRIEVRN